MLLQSNKLFQRAFGNNYFHVSVVQAWWQRALFRSWKMWVWKVHLFPPYCRHDRLVQWTVLRVWRLLMSLFWQRLLWRYFYIIKHFYILLVVPNVPRLMCEYYNWNSLYEIVCTLDTDHRRKFFLVPYYLFSAGSKNLTGICLYVVYIMYVYRYFYRYVFSM